MRNTIIINLNKNDLDNQIVPIPVDKLQRKLGS